MGSFLTFDDVLSLGMLMAFMGTVAGIVAFSRLPRQVKLLVYAALILRVIGAWLRYTILYDFYDGVGDATGYYRRGLAFADRFWQLDFSPFYDSTLWLRAEKWWGTNFVSFPSGIVLTAIGPSMRGEFLAFSLIGFLGLVCFAVAFRRAYPNVPVWRYALWIWLFPSLWYWPSSVGKESIVLFGLGLVALGFVGRGRSISWVPLIAGMFLIFAIRPQVAAVAMLAIVLAQWLSLSGGWTVAKMAQGILILAVGLGGIWYSMETIGVGGFDAEGVESYMDERARRSGGDGSGIEAAGRSIGGVPLAVINILSRPFIWEASNIMMLVSALEILGFWGIMWYRRRNLVNALRSWRSDRFLRLAVPFALMYTITLGMVIANLGILARQRVFLFPFLFLLIEALPKAHTAVRHASRPVRRPQLAREVAT